MTDTSQTPIAPVPPSGPIASPLPRVDLPERTVKHLNVTLREHGVTEEMRKKYNLSEFSDRGFSISDAHYNKLAQNLTDTLAYALTRRVAEILLTDEHLSSASYSFENGFTVTYNIEGL